jgi:hypothetical protein
MNQRLSMITMMNDDRLNRFKNETAHVNMASQNIHRKRASLRMKLACSVITRFTTGLPLLVGSIAMKVNSPDAGKDIETPRSIACPLPRVLHRLT